MPLYRISKKKRTSKEKGRSFTESPYTSEVVELPTRPPFKHGVRVKRVG